MTFIVATNVIASRPPERPPTGTPHAHANIRMRSKFIHVLTTKAWAQVELLANTKDTYLNMLLLLQEISP